MDDSPWSISFEDSHADVEELPDFFC